MRKNKMMRLASGLLVATLLTTSVISGTFAKYVTTNSGKDSATVAKFGVTINVADDMGLFKTTYDKTSEEEGNTVVSATANAKVVAPGTKGSMKFSISGTPEVATQLTVAVDNTTAIHLAGGTYKLDAGKFAEKDCSVTTNADYEPIKWYFGEAAIGDDTKYEMTLTDLETALEKLTTENKPNVALDKTYYIGWKWDFEPETDFTGTWGYNDGTAVPYTDATVADFLDTYLGDEAKLQTESFTLKITVTQID